MAARSKKATRGSANPVDPAAVLADYAEWLGRQPLAERSRDAYLAQVSGFVTWLAGSQHGAGALGEPNVREELAQVAPRSLEEADQRRFLRAVEGCPSARDRAIATVFFYTGVRLSELAALEVVDLSVSARRGRLKVRSGKGDAYREVPLNSVCRNAIDEWTDARAGQLAALIEASGPGAETDALWLSRTGGRMSTRAIDLVIRRLAKDANLELSAHTLRHTAVTNLIRSGADVVMVAEIAGHRRLDTTRRYSLPSEADKDAALEAVLVET